MVVGFCLQPAVVITNGLKIIYKIPEDIKKLAEGENTNVH